MRKSVLVSAGAITLGFVAAMVSLTLPNSVFNAGAVGTVAGVLGFVLGAGTSSTKPTTTSGFLIGCAWGVPSAVAALIALGRLEGQVWTEVLAPTIDRSTLLAPSVIGFIGGAMSSSVQFRSGGASATATVLFSLFIGVAWSGALNLGVAVAMVYALKLIPAGLTSIWLQSAYFFGAALLAGLAVASIAVPVQEGLRRYWLETQDAYTEKPTQGRNGGAQVPTA